MAGKDFCRLFDNTRNDPPQGQAATRYAPLAKKKSIFTSEIKHNSSTFGIE
jgi:hypothetical protein